MRLQQQIKTRGTNKVKDPSDLNKRTWVWTRGHEPTSSSSTRTDSLGEPRHAPSNTREQEATQLPPTPRHSRSPPRLPAGILGTSMQSPAAARLLGLTQMRVQFRSMQPCGHSTPCWIAEGAALGPDSTNNSFISPPLKKNYLEAQRLLFQC